MKNPPNQCHNPKVFALYLCWDSELKTFDISYFLVAECAATAQLGQDPQLPAELLSLPSGETQVIRIHRNGTTLEMAVATTLFVARGMERRLISFKNIHYVLERNEMESWQKLIRVPTHRNHEFHYSYHFLL